ncbi:MAG: hypothetical protein AAF590_02975 [Pseudomonadota bacterium]
MNQAEENIVPIASRAGRLSEAVQRVRARLDEEEAAKQSDGREHLSALLEELRDVASDVPHEHAGVFPLAVSLDQSKIIVDDLAFVDFDPDTGSYSFNRLHNEGVRLLMSSQDVASMADRIADYIAERIVERERPHMRQSGGVQASAYTPRSFPANDDNATSIASVSTRQGLGFWGGLFVFFLGGLCAATALFTYAWLAAG